MNPTQPYERLRYRDAAGTWTEVKAVPDGDDARPATPLLRARRLRLERPEGTMAVRQVRPRPDAATAGEAYEALDNEILAGLRLSRFAAGGAYPLEFSELVGFDADAAEPYALLKPYRGVAVAEIAGKLLLRERRRFQVSMVSALRLLSAAGVVHRGISPLTVKWDGQSVQIVDFGVATIPGAPRRVAGAPPWWAPEQRPGRAVGDVTDNDDVWAVGRLIHYVITGTELDDVRRLAEVPELAVLLEGIFGPPENRPTPRTLLRRLDAVDPVPRGLGGDPEFEHGRGEFFRHRKRKHPGAPPLGEPELEPEPEQPAPPPAPPGDDAREPEQRTGGWRFGKRRT